MADAGMKEPQSPVHGIVEVGAADLMGPGVVFCPHPRMPLWSNHPRVFLDLAASGSARCPYCSTTYRLKAGEKLSSGH